MNACFKMLNHLAFPNSTSPDFSLLTSHNWTELSKTCITCVPLTGVKNQRRELFRSKLLCRPNQIPNSNLQGMSKRVLHVTAKGKGKKWPEDQKRKETKDGSLLLRRKQVPEILTSKNISIFFFFFLCHVFLFDIPLFSVSQTKIYCKFFDGRKMESIFKC